MDGLAYETLLVGGSSGKGTSDSLEQRKAIRQMCGYITDDAKIAGYHGVSVEDVRRVRDGIQLAKRKGCERTTISHHATGTDAINPFEGENRMRAMIRRGSELLLEAIVRERSTSTVGVNRSGCGA